MAEQRIVISPPLALKAYMVVFGIMWCGLLGFVVIASVVNDPSPLTAIPLGMLIFGLVIIVSNIRMRVIVEGEQLRVRNFLSEHRYERAGIDRFVEHSPGGLPRPLGTAIGMLLNDGRMIDLRVSARGPFGRARMARDLEQLKSWLQG